MKTRYYLTIFLFYLIFYSNNSFSQSHGLGFFSHEVVQDHRTSLDLSPGSALSFDKNFSLAFDLNFFPGRDDYFGYIFRIVVNDTQNVDLIYDYIFEEKDHFKLVSGSNFSKIAFNIKPSLLFGTWNRIKLDFDFAGQKITLTSGAYSGSTPFKIKAGDRLKILFGANRDEKFKTSDNPPMKIRNIEINQGGKVVSHWPLDQYDGTVVNDRINGEDALATRPLWIKKMHYEWQRIGSFTVKGPASVAFNPKKEVVYIVENDSLKSFSVVDSKIKAVAYKNNLTLLRGNHSLFDDDNGRLFNFYIDQKIVSVFDTLKSTWSKNYTKTPITDFWQFNKFYSKTDSSLYIFGGYGHFIYKNQVQRYHFPSGKWKEEQFTGDVYTPRYLAALGKSGNGAYIIGGYGSTTGKQMLSPTNIYDLLYFDVAEKTIKKIYDFKVNGEDFVFANSMIINEKDQTFYGLVFPRHKYNARLQLISGSLKKPGYKFMGSKIPFQFHDINSYADLYYSPASKKIIAVTTFRDSIDVTHVNVYSLNALPLDSPDKLFARHPYFWYWLAAGFLLCLSFLIFFFRVRKPIAIPVSADEQIKAEQKLPQTNATTGKPESLPQSAVFLFGDLQVFDDHGNEITKQFTPLIKELFLVILLYTIRWERGISSERLKELLWFDKTNESAQNNRSVNIAKLKVILEKMNNCKVSKETGYWRIKFDPTETYVDYQQYVDIIKDKARLDKTKIIQLAQIIKRGSFLPAVGYEWIDSFKAEISNEIIDTYLHYAGTITIASDPELLIEIANYIFYFDSVNEEAMVIKCKALVHMGKHSQAKNAFENFCKEYRLLYGEDFDKNFSKVLSANVEDIN
ncbi:two-component SAPR family response regulator [Flavobacterium sp. W4I14]|nr:two-component SAPR family response regulator [Flavobacterium sp. W4I14]